jgi:hypothetical protein
MKEIASETSWRTRLTVNANPLKQLLMLVEALVMTSWTGSHPQTLWKFVRDVLKTKLTIWRVLLIQLGKETPYQQANPYEAGMVWHLIVHPTASDHAL